MGTIPTITTFTAGAVLTATQMNNMKDVADFWALTPRCSVYQSSVTSISNSAASWTVVAFQAEVFDVVQSGDSPMHDNVTNNSRIVIRTAGKYEIAGQVQFASNSTGYRAVSVRLNAAGSGSGGTLLAQTNVDASSTTVVSVPLPAVEVDLSVGDYIEAFGQQNSGGALNTVAGSGISFLRVKLTGT